ncbi:MULTISPECIES: hypothetical protein [Paenibacillus]|uniref:hypothetical protein n=1 Tax=Paenibacillus TaxID=44249 RepID=UPI00240DDC70|nr:MULTISPECIES: hypothetical protein [Paenibacillus]MCI1776593.1 hypothetical protein [Paenibacillus lautus]WFB57578.1 hypothetical protein P0X86_27025 [Paenibacillus sp. BR1-192]
MYIFSLLPSIIFVMFLALIAGFFLRFLSEGASFKVAVLSIFRFAFLPIAFILLISEIYKKKRRLIYEVKKTEENEEFVAKLEELLNSKWKLTLFLITAVLRFPRILLDSYIKSSIAYENKKTAKIKVKKEDAFYDFFLKDFDITKLIIHRV